MKTRLDKQVASFYSISRSAAQKLIKSGHVFVDNVVQQTPATIISTQQVINATIPETVSQEILPENIPLTVLYEDAHTLVIDKQSGLSVTVSENEFSHTITNALLYQYPFLADVSRYGIVHRLDKETSGVLLIAKDAVAQSFYMSQFKNRQIKKEYIAFCDGEVGEMVIEKPIARNPHNRKKMAIVPTGKYAYTQIIPLETYRLYTKVKLLPTTGRTHQLRVHLKSIGHPIVGDRLYHGSTYAHMLLHAASLSFMTMHEHVLEVKAPLPEYFDSFASSL